MGSCMKFLFFMGAIGLGAFVFYYAEINNPSVRYRECGNRPERLGKFRKPRMIGAENVNVDVWPWQVSVMYQSNSSVPFSQICGGAIIDDYWIMTAASCANVQNQSKLLIRAGSSRLDVDDEFTQKLQVARIIKHELFNPVTLRYSIALFEMETPFVFNEFVYPICVPDNVAADHKLSCHITGYNAQPGGDFGVLQEANVFIMSRSLCNKPTYWNYTVSADMLCVGEYGGGVDGCETNLGGPLACYVEIERRYYLIGIRVKATSCGEPNRPNIYLKVNSLYYWIEREMNISFH